MEAEQEKGGGGGVVFSTTAAGEKDASSKQVAKPRAELQKAPRRSVDPEDSEPTAPSSYKFLPGVESACRSLSKAIGCLTWLVGRAAFPRPPLVSGHPRDRFGSLGTRPQTQASSGQSKLVPVPSRVS